MFHFKGDVNGRHNYPGKPALNPILGILFIAGLTFAVKNWKNPLNLFAICYLLFAIFPTILTYPWENPNMLRTFTAIPSVIYFIGLAIIVIPAKAGIYLNRLQIKSGKIIFNLINSSFLSL